MYKTKKRFNTQSKKKQDAAITSDTQLILSANKIKELLSLVPGRKARQLIFSNFISKSVEGLKRYKLNAPSLVKNAEDNRVNLIKNATPQEIKVKAILKDLKIGFEFQKIYYTGLGYYIVDFYLPKYKAVLEIDGNQHLKAFDVKKDELRTENLIHIHKVKKVIRFLNKEVVNDTDCINKLKEELGL